MTRKLPKSDRIGGIAHAAMSEFLQKGFENATMEGIARRAGVSKGCVYHHFRGKNEVLLQANQILSEPVTGMMAAARSSPSARAGLRRYIRQYLRYWRTHPQELSFFFLSFAKVLEQPALWAMYEAYTESVLGFFQAMLQRGIDAGELPDHDTRQRGAALMSALDGLIGYLMLDPRLQERKIAAELERLFLTGVEADGISARQQG